MPSDSNGNYSLPASYFVQNGDTVLPVQHNPPFEDVASGLTNRIMKDGRTVWTGDMKAGGFKVTGMADGTNPADAVTKSQLDAVDEGKLDADGDNATDRTKWRLKPIGEIVYLDTSLTGVEIPPIDAGFIELTAGLDGVGEYNEGKLTSESVTGTAPLVVATAVIDDADSPMDGQTIHLLNTEERVVYAGERSKAGDVFNDQMQQITGSFKAGRTDNTGEGAFETINPSETSSAGTGGANEFRVQFDSADSPDARTGDRTRAKGQFLVAFLKYKDVV